MKAKFFASLGLSLLAGSSLYAVDRTRTATTDTLNLAAAWNPAGAPTTADLLLWDASSTLSNTMGANFTAGGINISSAAGAVSIAGANTLLLDHSTDANTIFATGANDFTWGAAATGGAFNINGAGPTTSSTATGATFSGSGTVTISSTGAKNWSTNGNSNGVTNLNFTGTLALRGATIPAVGGVTTNWIALGGGGGAASDLGTLVQTGSFALDTGDASSCGGLILTQAWSGQFLKLNRLQGTGSIRADWGISAGTQTRGIELTQADDTIFAGSILAHNGSNQRRNISFVKKGAGALTLTGALGSSQAAANSPAALNFDIQAGTLQLGNGTNNIVYQNGANWDATSSFIVGSGATLRFMTAGSFTWSRAITGGSGTIELSTDGDPSDGAVVFSANHSAFSGNINLNAGSLRMGPNLGTGTLTVKSGTFISVATAATAGTTNLGALTLEDATESDFRLGATSDKIVASGQLTAPATGTHQFNLSGTPVSGGTIKLIDYSGTALSPADFAKFTLNTTTLGAATLSLVNNIADTSVDLLITLEDQVWKGSTDGNWDNTTTNWAFASTPAIAIAFDAGNPSIFNDSAAIFAVIVDAAGMSPSAMNLNHSTNDYTFTGGEIFGSFPLIKNGTSKATIALNLANTDGLIINAGTLEIGDGGATGNIGTGPIVVAAGATLAFNLDNTVLLDYKTNAKLRNVSGAGDIVLSGGHTLFNYTGTGVGFNEANSWNLFSGNLIVKGGSEFRTIRNGATAMGTGDLILGDATTSGTLAQIEGNWTFTNDIVLVGPANVITNRSLVGAGGRSMKLQGIISGAGGLSLQDAASSFTDVNRGYIITGNNTLNGTLSIAANTPVRIGGVPGNVDANFLSADSSGSLGSASVANEGTLTFSRLDAHTVTNVISGAGNLRVGLPSIAALGNTSTQVVTYNALGTWTGTMSINNGTMIVPTAAIAGAGDISIESTGTLQLDGQAGALTKLLTVQTGGTLTGSGSTASDVIVNGAIAPGSSTGTFTSTAVVDFNSSSIYQWDAANWSGTIAGTDWDLIAADQLNLNAVDGSDIIIRIGSSVSGFTESNKTFRIASAATALSGFDATAITIDATAFATATGALGTWAVQQNGNHLDLVYTANTDPYITWAAARGLSGGAAAVDADPDGDGINNLLEFALATEPNPANPNSQSQGALPTPVISGTNLIFTHRLADAAAALSRHVQYSSDLNAWTDSANGTNGVTVVVTDDFYGTGIDKVETTLPISLAAQGKLFARLRVVK